MSAFSNTCWTVVSCHRPYRYFDCLLPIKVALVYYSVQPPCIVYGLDLAEDGLDGVEFRAVTYVPYRYNIQLWVERVDLSRIVNCEPVHDNGKTSLAKAWTKVLQVVDELLWCDSLLVDAILPYSVLLGHRDDCSHVAGEDVFLIHGEVRVRSGPVFHQDRSLGEADLVEVQYLPVFTLCFSNLISKLYAITMECVPCFFWHVFLLSHLFTLDSMLEIEASQRGDCYSFCRESAVEEFCSILERKARPLLKRLVTSQILDVFLF